MNMRSLVIAAILGASATLTAQTPATPAAKFVDSARTEIDAAALAHDDARLANAVIMLDRALVAFPGDPYLLHYRGYAGYRQAVSHLIKGDMPGAMQFVDRAFTDLQESVKKLPWPEAYSLLAAMTGLRIAADPMSNKAVLGPQSMAFSQQAMQLGPNNPRVLYLAAQSTYRTPVEYGGGVDAARTLLGRALEAFKTDKPGPLMPGWGREEAMAFDTQIGH